MTKSEAEKAVRHLCHEWRRLSGNASTPASDLSSSDFIAWLRTNHPDALNFRSTAGPRYDIELWFDNVFGQSWAR